MLKIGILHDPSRSLDDWEVQLLSELIRSDYAKITTVFVNGHATDHHPSRIRRLLERNRNRGILQAVLLKVVHMIELRAFSPNPRSAEAAEVMEHLATLPQVHLYPTRRGYVDHFGPEDAEKIEQLEIDVLLRHHFGIIRGPILSAPKHGIWSYHHSDNAVIRGMPEGFWESYHSHPVTGATLQILTDELDGGQVVDKVFISTRKLWFTNRYRIYEQSVPLMPKYLRLLEATGEVKVSKSGPYSKPLYREPKSNIICHYILKRYPERILNELFPRKEIWKLHVGTGTIDQAVLWRTRPIEPPRHEFWADPFVITIGGEDLIFFECFEYEKNKGKICFGSLRGLEIHDVQDALECDYHLSYPFLWVEDGQVYMIPETAATRRIEIWRAIDFPAKWELCATALEGESRADPTLFRDREGTLWLFTTRSYGSSTDYTEFLEIFRVGDLRFNRLEPHERNPVIADCRRARSAGSIFLNEEGEVMRPSQFNVSSMYGYGLNLGRIVELTIKRYQEEPVHRILPTFDQRLCGIHHVTQVKGRFVVDCRYRRR